MGRKNEISLINFKEIARELRISVMTLYRVLNNEPSVRPSTRARVVEALNRYGYYAHKPSREIRILFDFGDHAYLQHYGMRLMQRLSHREFACIASDHRRNPAKFFDAAAECDVVVYCSVPDNATVHRARELNPSACQIAIYTSCDADIVISSDNILGGAMAARHLHSMGHSHVAVHLSEAHPTRFDRYNSFFAELHNLDPHCRIDNITVRRHENMTELFSRYFRSVSSLPTAIFFLAGEYSQTFYNAFLRDDPEGRFRNLSILSYDRPEDVIPPQPGAVEFDRIEFLPQDILDWTEFDIINRPMMRNRTGVHTSIRPVLKITGSVKKIQGMPEK